MWGFQGGAWMCHIHLRGASHVETMVKIIKEALKRLHSGPCVTRLTADEFYTQLKRAQGFINMRPLLQVSVNHPPLTPTDFIGTGNSCLNSFVMEHEGRGASAHRFEQMEKDEKRVMEKVQRWIFNLVKKTRGANLRLPRNWRSGAR